MSATKRNQKHQLIANWRLQTVSAIAFKRRGIADLKLKNKIGNRKLKICNASNSNSFVSAIRIPQSAFRNRVVFRLHVFQPSPTPVSVFSELTGKRFRTII